MALHASAILNSINPRWRMLFWGEGSHAQAVVDLHEDWRADMLINAREHLGENISFTQIIPAADVALVTAPAELSLAPVLACMSNSLPIVAPATRAISDILEDRHTAMLYAPTTPRMAAQRLLTLSDDPALARRIADQARAEAYELFSVSRLLDTTRQLYG
jgi:glycosyltransferase involved in cell wall biosynthesis